MFLILITSQIVNLKMNGYVLELRECYQCGGETLVPMVKHLVSKPYDCIQDGLGKPPFVTSVTDPVADRMAAESEGSRVGMQTRPESPHMLKKTCASFITAAICFSSHKHGRRNTQQPKEHVRRKEKAYQMMSKIMVRVMMMGPMWRASVISARKTGEELVRKNKTAKNMR